MGVVIVMALPCWVHIRAPDFWKLGIIKVEEATNVLGSFHIELLHVVPRRLSFSPSMQHSAPSLVLFAERSVPRAPYNTPFFGVDGWSSRRKAFEGWAGCIKVSVEFHACR